MAQGESQNWEEAGYLQGKSGRTKKKEKKKKKKKKGWQEYTKELFNNDHDLDDHDGVITHLEPDNLYYDYIVWGFPSGSDSNQSAYNAGESACKAGLIPGSGRTLEKGMQYSCSENTMHR